MFWLVALAVAAALALAVFATRERRSAARVAGGLAAVLVAAWIGAAVLASAQVGDADGFIDCGEDCTGLQTAVGTVLFGAPVALLGVVAGYAAAAVSTRR